MKHLLSLLLVVCLAGVGKAGFEFSVFNTTGGGSFQLQAGAGQTFDIYLSSTNAADTLGSVGLRLSIAGTLATPTPPAFTGVTFATGSGSVSNLFGTPLTGGTVVTASQLTSDLTNLGGPVGFTGSLKLATVTVNTTGFEGTGPFNLSLVTPANGEFAFVNNPIGDAYTPVTLSGGSFSVITAIPEPSSAILSLIPTLALAFFRRKQAA